MSDWQWLLGDDVHLEPWQEDMVHALLAGARVGLNYQRQPTRHQRIAVDALMVVAAQLGGGRVAIHSYDDTYPDDVMAEAERMLERLVAGE